MRKVDINFFPGWTRKSVTFSIDDGNIPMDTKFLSIVRPAGILGTFNLCSHWTDKMSPAEYREFYRGYEIANHCKYHPQVFSDTMRFVISDEKFDPLGGEDYTGANPVVYRTGIEDELYILHGNPKNVRPRGRTIARRKITFALSKKEKESLRRYSAKEASQATFIRTASRVTQGSGNTYTPPTITP